MATGERFLNGRVTMHGGDMRDVLARSPECLFDSCVCDPPYHLQTITKRFAKVGRTDKTWSSSGPHQRTAAGFMGRGWDGGDIAFRVKTWRRVLRVMKPGSYLVAFSSTRTYHRMACAIEDAGFITHPLLIWAFGQGFPKAHRILFSGLSDLDCATQGWEGWRYGTQSLKPALEPIYVGQKPFEAGLNGSENVQKWGCGALNIDGCRIGTDEDLDGGAYTGSQRYDGAENWRFKNGGARQPMPGDERKGAALGMFQEGKTVGTEFRQPAGRWPANLVTDGSAEVLAAFPDAPGALRAVDASFAPKTGTAVYGDYGPRTRCEPRGDEGSAARFFASFPNGRSGEASAARRYDDAAGDFALLPGARREPVEPHRLFYTAKADGDDRLGSRHPTVKPLDLEQYLCRLVTPPGGTVLDCFAGTGTTGEAAWRAGLRAVLIEADPESQADIRRRMALAQASMAERRRESVKAKTKDKPADHGPLFGGEA